MVDTNEKWPEDRIVELTDELDQARSRLAFFERSVSVAAGQCVATPLIHRKLIEVMREVTSVAKTSMNTQQNYPFRGIDGVMNEVGPAMRKVGVLAIPTVLQYKNRDTFTTGEKKTREVVMEVRYDFYAEDGSSVSTVVWGESLDQSDKGTAKALSVALRQALLQTLMLPTQEPTTDDNGHYHTRSGTPTLSGWTANLGRKVLLGGTVAEVIDFWPAIVESSSIEAPWTPDGMTWGEATATRIAQLAAEELSPEALRELYGKLKTADMIALWHVEEAGRVQLGDLVVRRGKEVVANRVKAFNHGMGLVTSADTPEALDNAMAHLQVDAEEGSITREQLADLLVVAEERSKKFARELHVAAPSQDPEPTFLPSIGEAWDAFVAAANVERMDADQLNGLLTGEGGVMPACDFGVEGVQRFIDAVKRAHSGWRSITAEQRADLFGRLGDQMEGFGITWHEDIR